MQQAAAWHRRLDELFSAPSRKDEEAELQGKIAAALSALIAIAEDPAPLGAQGLLDRLRSDPKHAGPIGASVDMIMAALTLRRIRRLPTLPDVPCIQPKLGCFRAVARNRTTVEVHGELVPDILFGKVGIETKRIDVGTRLAVHVFTVDGDTAWNMGGCIYWVAATKPGRVAVHERGSMLRSRADQYAKDLIREARAGRLE